MHRITLDQARQGLTGPVASISTPFLADGSIDYPGLRRYVEFCLAAGSPALILTFGDSLYTLLTDDEVADVVRAVIDVNAGRALVVAGDRSWATPKAAEFARFVRDAGADLVMPLPPDWAGSCTVDSFVEHYAAVAAEMPCMLITAVFARRPLAQSMQVLERVRDEVSGVIAVKDDVAGPFGRSLGLLVHDRWAIISGGQKENFLDARPYGCDGYFSSFITFAPQIAQAFWDAVQADDSARMREIVAGYDMPYFEHILSLRGGFDAGVHGVLELFGIAGRWRRKPYYTLGDAEMEQLKGFFQGKGLL